MLCRYKAVFDVVVGVILICLRWQPVAVGDAFNYFKGFFSDEIGKEIRDLDQVVVAGF